MTPTAQTLDALRALVQKWQEAATTPMSLTPYHDPRSVYDACARDLEAVLSAALASASAGQAITIPLADSVFARSSAEIISAPPKPPVLAPPRAPETLYLLTGWRERAACLRRDGKAEASAAIDACADELRAALLRVPHAQETPRTCETEEGWALRCKEDHPCWLADFGDMESSAYYAELHETREAAEAFRSGLSDQDDWMPVFVRRSLTVAPAPPPPSERS